MHRMSLALAALWALLLPSGAEAQVQSPQSPKPPFAPTSPVRFLVQGTVRDLASDAAGRLLYVSAQKEVGRFDPGHGVTVLANAATGPFPNELRGVAATPAGDVAVVDIDGHVRVLFGGTAPAVQVYSDVFMIGDATDLIVDARGSFLIASATPSSGQRGVNWVSSDGTRWSYYLVRHQPVQLAAEPTTGGIVIADQASGGNLQLVQPGPYRRTVGIDTTTHPGFTSNLDDGDMAFDSQGTLFWISGGKVYRTVQSGTTLFASGYEQLRGIAIARSSLAANGWSLYLAEGSNPTRIREIPGSMPPASPIAADQGAVPSKGIRVPVTLGFQAFELTVDHFNRLVLGGSLWSSTHYVKRITLTGTPSIATVATSANGLSGIVEGLCVDVDNSILALTRAGTIHRITEGPLTITTLFTDPFDQISAGKDLAQDVNGALYVATREAWDFGKVMRVSGGTATLLKTTEETRGLAANPAGGMYVSQWHNSGFHGTVDLLHFGDNSLETLPGFITMNYTNDFVWGDGDICVDANGSIYTVSEDDWSLVRYDPAADAFVRFGSSYLNHPSGLVIAPSTAGSGSTTGWSLYVAEFDNVWEKPGVPPPASTLVDSSLGFRVGRSVAAAPNPTFGKPRVIAAAANGTGALVGTAEGWVLEVDPHGGAVQPLAGPESGLVGEIAGLWTAPGGRRVLALTTAGDAYALSASGVRRLELAPERLATALERAVGTPRRAVRLLDPRTGSGTWFALDGWVVWRVADER